MSTIKKSVKKAQTGGTYYASSNGRVGRLSGSKIGNTIVDTRNESIDTTGYSKGKKEFKKIESSSAEGNTAKKVKREDVTKVISELKKGATNKVDWRNSNQKDKNKLKSGGSVKAKDGKWMQKAAASIKRRGTEGKCTPITKPGCTGKAKALAKTFKKIAKSNKKK